MVLPKYNCFNANFFYSDAHDSKDGVTELLNPDSYNPGKQNYHPIQDATWKKGENVPYMVLAKTLELVIKN
jgi:hypothetical protein